MDNFEKLLYTLSEVAAEQSPDISNRIQPWRKMFGYLIWGMIFLLFEINLFGGAFGVALSYICPLIGCILLIKGLAICRTENRYFRIAYIVGFGYFIYLSALMVIRAIPIYEKRIPEGISILTFIEPVVCVLVLYNLIKGFERLFNDDKIEKIKVIFIEIIWMMLSVVLITVIVYYLKTYSILSNIGNIVIIIINVCEVIYLFQIRKILDEQGYYYSIQEKKKHYRYLTNIFILLDLIIMIVLTVYFVQYYSDYKEPVKINEIDITSEEIATNYRKEEIDDVKEQLVSMGMERYVVDDLLPVDVMKFKDVKRILKTSVEKEFEYNGAKIRVTCYLGERYYNEKEMDDTYFDSIEGKYLDEVLFYFEWINEPNQLDVEKIYAYTHDNYLSGNKKGDWIHIADVDGNRLYYENDVNVTHRVNSNSISIDSNASIIKNAVKKRSYIVYRSYSDEQNGRFHITLSYEKEQKRNSYFSSNSNDILSIYESPETNKEVHINFFITRNYDYKETKEISYKLSSD